MSPAFTESELEAYLDESLAPDMMAAIETALRSDTQLVQQLVAINRRRDAGLHSVGEIWRRHRVTCPTRAQLGSYLLGALSDEQADYIDFHIQRVGCRVCLANLNDLQRQQQEAADTIVTRRHKYFQSSAGHLRRK
jgi:hypothetical protein